MFQKGDKVMRPSPSGKGYEAGIFQGIAGPEFSVFNGEGKYLVRQGFLMGQASMNFRWDPEETIPFDEVLYTKYASKKLPRKRESISSNEALDVFESFLNETNYAGFNIDHESVENFEGWAEDLTTYSSEEIWEMISVLVDEGFLSKD